MRKQKTVDGCRVVLLFESARRERAKFVLCSLLLLSVASNVLLMVHLQDIEYQNMTFQYYGSSNRSHQEIAPKAVVEDRMDGDHGSRIRLKHQEKGIAAQKKKKAKANRSPLSLEADEVGNAKKSTNSTIRRRSLDKNKIPKNLAVIGPIQRPRLVNSDNRHDNNLHCELFGGPDNEASLRDMMYWRTDEFGLDDDLMPMESLLPKRYLIFEPDEAGFSNVRLSFENVVALAKITNRILVLPPATRFVQLLQGGRRGGIPSFYLADFFKIRNLPVISMQEFLETVPLTYRSNGTAAYPPHNRTNWDGRLGNSVHSFEGDGPLLYGWLNSTMLTYEWEREKHIVVVGDGIWTSQAMSTILKNSERTPPMMRFQKRVLEFLGKPPAVNASLTTRLQEVMGNRTELRNTSVYDDETVMMMQGHEDTKYRPLIQFYAYYFFEDWKHSLWIKRYIRDNLRFADFMQCAAARIVEAMRKHARQNGFPDGSFDTMHIRRKDFRSLPNYNQGTVPAAKLVRDHYFVDNRTVYIATDEDDPDYFKPLQQKYHVYLLKDFIHLIQGIDPNYYGMIEQLVCAKGDLFVGTFYSTFTAYINRLRGYYALQDNAPGHLEGSLNSEYFGHKGIHRQVLRQYNAPTYQLWTREWPIAWRDINHDLEL